MRHTKRDKMIIGLSGAVLLIAGVFGLAGYSIPGVLGVNVSHDALHVVSGLFAVSMVAAGRSSFRAYGRGFGVLYALVAVLSFISDHPFFGDLPVNASDGLFHLFLAALFLYVGYRQMVPHETYADTTASPV